MKERLGVAGLALMLVLLATGIAVACGDGAEEAKTPEAYVRSICDSFGKHGEGLQELVSTDIEQELGSDIEAGRKIMSDASVTLQDLAKDLDKIRPPADVQQQHQQMVSAFSTGAETLRKINELLDKPLSEAMKELEDLEPRLQELDEAFAAIGDFPADYQGLFESEPKCQEVEELLGS